ncbi:MAG: ribonuclease HII [Exiguobacterium sp.]|uniref:Ribonuclease HII n=1 Tax=Exiguobacterium alkaliphilum TaxID=1428684 RepID=A0ABT2L144_9BACL|nr:MULTISPECIES: ribonuclease HII [Exiguobacterium]MDX5323952.1 ribonuclease HII [Exiguobacterium sp.]KDN57450.1 ribonuclease H [Exiguobacterium sp. AB2]MCT4796346.1 ribonuclease HII [Exiguobacterium alkaliphilum]MDX5425772.1 ribonuclease HII [Exiguobacterium sp.]MDX6773171.1 ribonuclease HII [Exiguobacterium sp.]
MTIEEIKRRLETVRYEEWEAVRASFDTETRKGVLALIAKKDRQFLHEQAERDDYTSRMAFERELIASGFERIAGVDEVGRGPLAGPVVAAAVVLPDSFYHPGLNDSKKMSKRARERAFEQIMAEATVGVGIVAADVIDEVNIYEATKLAMQEAVERLDDVDALLIDAMRLELELPQTSLIKGDTRSVSIAAASVVAKVVRDKMMEDYAVLYPGYGFERNAGYGTKDHLSGLAERGVTPIHRKSFAPIKQM